MKFLKEGLVNTAEDVSKVCEELVEACSEHDITCYMLIDRGDSVMECGYYGELQLAEMLLSTITNSPKRLEVFAVLGKIAEAVLKGTTGKPSVGLSN